MSSHLKAYVLKTIRPDLVLKSVMQWKQVVTFIEHIFVWDMVIKHFILLAYLILDLRLCNYYPGDMDGDIEVREGETLLCWERLNCLLRNSRASKQQSQNWKPGNLPSAKQVEQHYWYSVWGLWLNHLNSLGIRFLLCKMKINNVIAQPLCNSNYPMIKI